MKKFVKVLLCMLAAALVFAACSGSGSTVSEEKSPVKPGAYADKIIYSVRSDDTICLKDIIEGKADMLFTPVPAKLLAGLSDEDRDKLDVYPVPSSYWSLLFNPIPDKAPYTWKTEDGEDFFNPMAIKEIRYAFNWLINRKKLVDELLLGEGKPQYTPCTPGAPGSYIYDLLAIKQGITDTGDEQKALEMIDDAMNKAASLPENKGKLIKENGKWMFNGKPVTVKSVMRVDDPQGRLPAARYIQDQLEKSGITVEGLERDRQTAGSIVYGGNPAKLEWTMYLEGWGSGGFYSTWETPLAQMYSPFNGYLPGGGEAEFWNYKNEILDSYGTKALFGQYLTADDFFKETVAMCDFGLKEAIRVYVVSENSLFVANKARLNSRLFYGISEGFNRWTVRGADVKPDTSGPYKGMRVLRVLQRSAQGSLFMDAWDPVGVQGFSSTYSTAFMSALTDRWSFDHPATGVYEEWGSTFDMKNAKYSPKLVATGKKTAQGGAEYIMGGNIPVPADAVIYDTAAKQWVPAESGQKVASAVSGKLVDNYFWHHGEPVDINDFRFAKAYKKEWCIQDGEDDPYFDQPLSGYLGTDIASEKGWTFNADGSITSYKNYYHAPDLRYTAAQVGGVDIEAGNPGRATVVPWEIYEAMSELAVHGSKSATVYNFAKDGGGRGTEIDTINAGCVADIKAKLEEFVAEKHIPLPLKGVVTEDQALKRYNASIGFIEKYGHAYISQGPFMIEKIDTVSSAMILTRVDKYPYMSDYFPNKFRVDLSIIERIKTLSSPSSDQDAVFEITVSKHTFPESETSPLENGKVEGRLQLPSGEKAYPAENAGGGKYTVTVPAADLSSLTKGTDYVMVILTSAGDESPASQSVKLTLLK